MFQCHKLDKLSNKPQVKNCIRFIELTQMKCPKQKALQFSVKKFCKYDSTKKIDGPSKQKLLVVPQQTFLIDKGWYQEEPFFTNTENYKNFVKLEKKSKWIEIYLKKQNRQTLEKKKKFINKIEQMQSFFKEINDKYKFKGKTKKQIFEKLSQIRNERQKLKEQQRNFNENQKKKLRKKNCSRFQQIAKNLHKTQEKFDNIKTYQLMLNNLVNSQPINKVDKKPSLKQIQTQRLILKEIQRNKSLVNDFNQCFYFLSDRNKQFFHY